MGVSKISYRISFTSYMYLKVNLSLCRCKSVQITWAVVIFAFMSDNIRY